MPVKLFFYMCQALAASNGTQLEPNKSVVQSAFRFPRIGILRPIFRLYYSPPSEVV